MRAPLPPTNMRRRVVVLFPSGLTLANLFFGVFAIVAASRENFMQAGWFVILGGIADAFDGRVARATNSEGRFGEELDSLVDAITFGLAPAMIMYFAVMNRDGWDWLWCFSFTACAVLRLARFNVEQAGTSKAYFHGLPSPAAGITLATYYWFSQSSLYNETAIANWSWHQMLRLVMATLGFLMISNVPYPVMPPVGFRSPRQLIGLGVLVCGTAMLIFGRLEYFFPLAVGYVAFGLLRGVILGLLDRSHVAMPAGWFPGGDRDAADDERPALDSVGDGFTDGEAGEPSFRRRRRRGGRGDRGDRGGTGPSNPT
ncbi:MAG: CDP-diacylglycerol--serine O-phosphatidyltransferase [Gemmatimonadota bacterium]